MHKRNHIGACLLEGNMSDVDPGFVYRHSLQGGGEVLING